MNTIVPLVYLLCGLPGSGKTTYAKTLEESGAMRLTLDEELFKRFGREYDNHDEKQAHIKEELKTILKEKLQIGESVILDFGFWKKVDREEYEALVESLGAKSKILYFKATKDVLLKRLTVRNSADAENNHIIDEALLDLFIAQFEEPVGEGEVVVNQEDSER